jgi:hypothetical protein
MSTDYECTDKVGRPVKVNDWVVFQYRSELVIRQVEKIELAFWINVKDHSPMYSDNCLVINDVVENNPQYFI